MSFILLQPSPSHHTPWGPVASVGAHVGLLALLLVFSPVRPLDASVQAPQSISVELIPPEKPAALPVPATPLTLPSQVTAPAEPPAAAAPAEPAPGARPAHAPNVGLTHATHLFAASILKDPSSSKIRKTLSTFADSEKLMQICNMEGLEQIRRANPKFNPDVLVSYAMAETSVDGMTLIADGGAFHTGKNWIAIRLRCTVAADYSGVTDFAFSIGDPIPKSEWNSHNLPAEYDDEE